MIVGYLGCEVFDISFSAAFFGAQETGPAKLSCYSCTDQSEACCLRSSNERSCRGPRHGHFLDGLSGKLNIIFMIMQI